MLNRIIRTIENIMNDIRSWIFCFRYLPFVEAKHCPVRLHWRVKVYISKQAKIYFRGGNISIGIHQGSYGLCCRATRFCIYDDSEVIINGDCCISRGTNIIVRYGGRLSISSGFFCNSNCNILVNKDISFGNQALLGWDVTVLDSDGHTIKADGVDGLPEKSINIGAHCWLGAKSTILKGVTLAEDTIVPYGTVCHKSNDDKYVVFANKVVKRNIIRNE